MQSEQVSAHAAKELVAGLRRWFSRDVPPVTGQLRLAPELKQFRSNQVVTFAAAEASEQVPKMMRVIGSCHTLEQLNGCRTWLSSLICNGTLSSFDSLQLLGAIDMSEGWLQRRFEPMQKAWKWQRKN